MSDSIQIFEDGVYAGDGDLLQTANGTSYVANCPAELGSNSAECEGAYEAIDAAINAGADSAECAGHRYTWTITD